MTQNKEANSMPTSTAKSPNTTAPERAAVNSQSEVVTLLRVIIKNQKELISIQNEVAQHLANACGVLDSIKTSLP